MLGWLVGWLAAHSFGRLTNKIFNLYANSKQFKGVVKKSF